jgi:ferric-dicitrate binding protein FerR (iron transport regulator)
MLHRLRGMDLPKTGLRKHGSRAAARVDARRWLIELESTERLDEIWPQFEAWLDEHPDNYEMYLRVERARRTMDRLGRYCPTEGSAEAERLLSFIRSWAVRRRGRAARLLWATIGVFFLAVITITVAYL